MIKKRYIYLWTVMLLASIFIGCGDKKTKEESLTEGGMKCGAGKCGSSMVDGDSVVAKKKKNILSQMREDDKRKDCVLKASTNKKLYECIRDPKTDRLTTKCGNDAKVSPKKSSETKCASGKCSSDMQKPKKVDIPKELEKPKKVEKKEEAMKCAAGKCGGK